MRGARLGRAAPRDSLERFQLETSTNSNQKLRLLSNFRERLLRGGVDLAERHVVFDGDAAARFVLRREMDRAVVQPAELAVDRPPGGCHLPDLARSTCRAVVQRRMPNVPVSRKTIASMAAIFSARQRTESFTPGRFFFIWMAVV